MKWKREGEKKCKREIAERREAVFLGIKDLSRGERTEVMGKNVDGEEEEGQAWTYIYLFILF